jgi:hypothetical protein
MKRIFSMTLESWNTFFQVVSAIALALTFGAGTGAIVTGYVLGKRQSERIAATERGTAEANRKAAELDVEAAQQRARAAQAEHDLLALQQRLAPRRISPGAHATFVAALAPYHGSTVVITRLGDLEAGRFADDIISVLTEAGWTVQTVGVGAIIPPEYGLRCSINEQSPAGTALAAVLGKLPTARIESSPGLPVVARMVVGLKPPP